MNRSAMSQSAVTFFFIFSLLLSGPAPAEDESKPKPATLEELKAAIARVVEENEVPAVGVAMVDETGPVWVGAIGKASLENSIDADEDSMFRIGSTSKMFVALSVLKLVEGAFRLVEEPALTALNMRLRDDYVRDCTKGVGRWNTIIQKSGIDFELRLPNVAFHRAIGEFAGIEATPDGELLDAAACCSASI